MIKIFIADDHKLMIDGVRSTLMGVQDFEIVGEADNGCHVIRELETGLEVDVILMDINMPKMDGAECTKIISKKYPAIKTIALSQYEDQKNVLKMIESGAYGYLLKDIDKDELVEAIRTVKSGQKYLCKRLSKKLIDKALGIYQKETFSPKLTKREIEILSLICDEYSSQEIADKLFISFHTVESHRANLINKAGVKNTAGLVRWAVENHLNE